MVRGGYQSSLGPKLDLYARVPGGPWTTSSPSWPGPFERVQDHKNLNSPNVEGEVLAMSSKLTELTYSSPSPPPPSVLCGSGILSRLASPWLMASSSQTHDGYKAVEVLDPDCPECLVKGKDCFQYFNTKSSKCHFCFVGKKPCCCSGPEASNVKRYLWSKKDGPFRKEFPVSEGPTPDGTSGSSDCNPSPSQPPSKRFQIFLIPSTPRKFQQNLATIPTSLPPASPSSSHTSRAIIPEVRPSPIQQSRTSPMVTSQQLQ
ncbi:hypothetical protein O181_042431 [Austropuccinia psidii MF-1]|uniref:Uncharacterized protein n=1 Tax=Austropuccinia psidii MF-1 TaxID=1389203 RepID=A0A9Q3DLM1_9BASI|nr:hypothetical protein [Austropuccinia psidii MF-1]